MIVLSSCRPFVAHCCLQRTYIGKFFQRVGCPEYQSDIFNNLACNWPKVRSMSLGSNGQTWQKFWCNLEPYLKRKCKSCSNWTIFNLVVEFFFEQRSTKSKLILKRSAQNFFFFRFDFYWLSKSFFDVKHHLIILSEIFI